jgi:energy-coupling factor transporter ATP-binding protein EcfA2
MIPQFSEVVTYWQAVVGTLGQRGLLKTRRDGTQLTPQAVGVVTDEFVAFVLDMHRLAGIPREAWLDENLWLQIRATLQGRRCFVADSAGLALVVARQPGPSARQKRLPARLPLDPDGLPPGDYVALLGQSASGDVTLDLAEGERAILVGGTTGSGKTGTVRALALQLARKHPPESLSLAIVDLKQLDFPILNRLPHLVRPVATTEPEAVDLVHWAVQEMARRRAVMTAAGVTRWDRLPPADRFPLLLLIVDEVADFADSAVMGHLVELARKSRASGIALILATQRPDATVLNRQVKANLTTRLALRVTDQTESRIILDRGGAEGLTRPGQAITNAGGRWQRVQTVYVPDEQLGDWLPFVQPASILSEQERALVRYALEELDGAFIINRLYEAGVSGVSKRALTELAQQWEMRGWLTEPEHRAAPRRVTDELAALCPPLGPKSGDTVTRVTRDDTGDTW